MNVETTPASPDDLAAIAELAATTQADPGAFVAYFGEHRDVIASEIEDVDRWAEVTMVARRGDEVVGWLLAETEPEIDRIWWWGPVVAPGVPWDDVADRLYRSARERVDAAFDQEELAADDRSGRLRAFAERHGFTAEEASVLLRATTTRSSADRVVEALADIDHHAVAALHDELFPGTHTPGHQLVGKGGAIQLVVRESGSPVGYVSVDVQPDGAGYIDYLGVAPAHRGRGLGRMLVAAALADLHDRGSTEAFLTVRESNVAARALYASLAFVEERILRPYRRGFTLP